jgi:hypothetical protein
LKELPNNLKVKESLHLTNTSIEKLPDNLKVSSFISLDNTPLAKNKKLLNQYKKRFIIFT